VESLVIRQDIDAAFRRHRLRIMLAITLGYGFIYTCRLGLSIVKKPLIDGGIFTVEELGMIGAALFYGYASSTASCRTISSPGCSSVPVFFCQP
jgi:sugar phosphate permease